MQSLDPLFARLSRSKFRSRFRLGMKERQYCLEKGAPVIEQHAGILSLNVLLRHYRLMTVSKPPCAGIQCLSLSTPLQPVVAVVWLSGITFRRVFR